MTFSTELVARTGTLANLITASVTSGTSSSWYVDLDLPAGTWLVVARGRGSARAWDQGSPSISIDGAVRTRAQSETGATDVANLTASHTVTGGRQVRVAISGTSASNGWDFYAARIPG